MTENSDNKIMKELPELPRATWRLLDTGFSDGATNMAIDEAMMQAVAEKKAPPTLRFYGWNPPCVSVGYTQSMLDEVDLDKCRQKGYKWVRRPTGGRAILHIDELTYSVVAHQREPRVAGDIITSYRRLSLGLVEGLRSLNPSINQTDLMESTNPLEKSAACFDMPSHYEVTALGRKLIGSAQVRRKGAVLQHGALPLKGDVSRLVEILSMPEPDKHRLRSKLRQRAIALDEAVGRVVTHDEAAKVLSLGFAEALNLVLEPGVLSSYECEKTDDLRSKYLNDEWTYGK